MGPAPDTLPPLPPSLAARLGTGPVPTSVSDSDEVVVGGVPSLADLGYGDCEDEVRDFGG